MFGHHGVLERERREGQTFLYDVTLVVAEPPADRVEETIDYREVAATIREVSASQRFQLIETLAAAVAAALAAAFPAEHVRVRVRKPRPGGMPMEWSAATAERPRAGP